MKTHVSEFREAAEVERAYMILELQCARRRVRLLLNEVDRIGVALKGNLIDVDTAMEWLCEARGLDFFADDATTARLADDEEMAPGALARMGQSNADGTAQLRGNIRSNPDGTADDGVAISAAGEEAVEKLRRIARLLEYLPGVNDERDSVPLLMAIKKVMEGEDDDAAEACKSEGERKLPVRVGRLAVHGNGESDGRRENGGTVPE